MRITYGLSVLSRTSLYSCGQENTLYPCMNCHHVGIKNSISWCVSRIILEFRLSSIKDKKANLWGTKMIITSDMRNRIYYTSMVQCKSAVSPVQKHWWYCSLVLSHRHGLYSSYLMGRYQERYIDGKADGWTQRDMWLREQIDKHFHMFFTHATYTGRAWTLDNWTNYHTFSRGLSFASATFKNSCLFWQTFSYSICNQGTTEIQGYLADGRLSIWRQMRQNSTN